MDVECILDYIICFLQGPFFLGPIGIFVDEHCVVFDKDDENKFSFTEIHVRFRDLVEKLFQENLFEIGVTDEQFMKAVQIGSGTELGKKVVETLLVLDDFLVFKALMVKRNIELDNRVLQHIAYMPVSALSSAPTNFFHDEDLELANDKNIEAALLVSLDEEKIRLEASQRDEDAALATAISLSLNFETNKPHVVDCVESVEPGAVKRLLTLQDDVTNNSLQSEIVSQVANESAINFDPSVGSNLFHKEHFFPASRKLLPPINKNDTRRDVDFTSDVESRKLQIIEERKKFLAQDNQEIEKAMKQAKQTLDEKRVLLKKPDLDAVKLKFLEEERLKNYRAFEK